MVLPVSLTLTNGTVISWWPATPNSSVIADGELVKAPQLVQGKNEGSAGDFREPDGGTNGILAAAVYKTLDKQRIVLLTSVPNGAQNTTKIAVFPACGCTTINGDLLRSILKDPNYGDTALITTVDASGNNITLVGSSTINPGKGDDLLAAFDIEYISNSSPPASHAAGIHKSQLMTHGAARAPAAHRETPTPESPTKGDE